uniref:Selenoprotein O n=1 Tax=Parasteatoda tepidariorum TaxID=114398 RepID=A0A2L2Y9J1_PARTP
MTTLESLKFDNLALKKLPIDNEDKNYVRTVRGACFSKVKPTPVKNPKLVALSKAALQLLDLSDTEIERKDLVEYFSGNKLLPESEPASHCYCGHQFGYFSGQLGDGAAIYLGEILNKKNERWEIQLKGAGLTPYSRTADGRKVLRSSIREFLCSEAMHFLNIPTSRAGTCITSDSEVIRDIFYDGHPKPEKCTIVLRIAPTFIRFGSFEIFNTLDPLTEKVGPSVGRIDILNTLLNYVIDTFYPEIAANTESQEQKYIAFFKEIVLRTARLVALWQSVGFCHGVLNTDNMSIVGLTLDYGPFGFLDIYNPNHVCNASDDGGRYTFIKQPEICLWNLQKLAEGIKKALPLEKSIPLLELYQTEFQATFMRKMQDKLGLVARLTSDDKLLIEELFETMENVGADFTNTFLCFSCIDAHALEETTQICKELLLEQCYPLAVMTDSYNPKINPIQMQMILAIANSNPDILDQLGRNGQAIRRIISQLQKLESLKQMTEESKRENDEKLWNKWLMKYKKRIEQDIACYEGDTQSYLTERLNLLKNSNPRFILRNYILQAAIEKAEKGDFSEVQKLVEIVKNPYESTHVEGAANVTTRANTTENEASTSKEFISSCEPLNKAPSWGFSVKVS